MPDVATHAWPLEARPTLVTADRFPLTCRDFDVEYLSRTHALPVHEYEATMLLAGRRIALKPGDFTFTPAEWPSSYDLPQPGFHWCIHCLPPTLSGACVAVPLHVPLGLHHDAIVEQFRHLSQLRARASQPGPDQAAAAIAAGAALHSLVLWLSLLAGQGGDWQRERGTRAIAIVDRLTVTIQEHLDGTLSVPHLARQAEVSQNYLARCFRQRHGVSIPHYILQRRMDLARLLLRTTELPVKEVAIRAGLPDAQHFNKQFRRIVGLSPTAYRATSQRPEA